ncbi:MAG: SpoIID/LytB domain-containing protein [Armatimonadota bacterium]
MALRLWVTAAACALIHAVALAGSSDITTVRVGLNYGPTAVQSVKVSGSGTGSGERATVVFSGDLTASARGGEVIVRRDGESIPMGAWIELAPTGRDPWLELDNATYRGKLRIEPAPDGRLRVVNIVDIEDYVRGVVPNEMFADLEAYKVQAVVSRTYLVYVRDVEHKHAADGFDICTTGHCQVYRGVDSEQLLADDAVEATRGQVLTYQGKPIFSAYHSNAGGVTQTVDDAWPGSVRRNFPYLSQVDSPYDGEVGAITRLGWCYRWEREVSAADLAKRLRNRGKDVGQVQDITILGTNNTGRVRGIEVVGASGRARFCTPTEVRELLGIPSERFTIEAGPAGFRMTGWGNGHGVGLSQHGAFGMSKAGYKCDQILGQYYRGVQLTEGYGRGASRPLSPPDLRVTAAQPRPVSIPPGLGTS